MTTTELIVKLKEIDPSGTMTVVSAGGDEIFTMSDDLISICKYYPLTEDEWIDYLPPNSTYKLPGPFAVVTIF